VVSYKTIHSNIYTVQVVDISSENPWPIFKHESFQLWESTITAFLINQNKEYVLVNRNGINIISLCNEKHKRSVKTKSGQEKMIHSLESINYLKVDQQNYVQF